MTRPGGPSVRLKLTLSYAAFLLLAGLLLMTAVWVFLLRSYPLSVLVPRVDNLVRILDPTNFGPGVFGAAATVSLVFLLVFGLVGGWLLAGRMLAPLTRITDATRLAADGSLTHRIRLPGRDDEFRELADAFDAMLAQLETHLAEQQRFAADASHELRTPLAVTQAMLEVARRDPERDPAELVERLLFVNTRAIELTEALLLLSRADRRSFTREKVDLSLAADEAIETLLPLAEQRGLTVTGTGDLAHTTGSHALLQQLVNNLVHNAIVHNVPDGGHVWISTTGGPRTVGITVANTGPVLAPHAVAALVEPFRRGTARTRSDHAGVGLGLAIVASITRAHDGTLDIVARDGGGLSVTVRLPAAP